MNKLLFPLLLILIVGFCFSCKKIKDADAIIPPVDTTKIPPVDTTKVVLSYVTKEIEIIVPSGSSFKPAGSTVLSFGTEQTADAAGKAKVTFEKGSSTLAYVFDNNKKLVLAGFITDSTNVISPATTAKVLLYLGYNIPLQSDTLSTYFLNNINKLQGAKDWEKEFETLFLSDPLTLSNKSFVAPLKARLAKMIDQTPAIDIRGKAAEIHVDANDKRSGIQIAADGLSMFKITNYYRRRAHAFLYKMSYKDLNGSNTILKRYIESGAIAEMDVAINATAPVNSFIGELGKHFIEGTGQESFSVTSGPFPLELKDNESEALYSIRVIGPGRGVISLKTDEEQKKLVQLEIETFLLDLVTPAISLVASRPERPTGAWPDVERTLRADALLSLLKSMPDVTAELKNGDYKQALRKFLINVAGDVSGVLMKEAIMISLGKELNGSVSSHFNQKFEKLLYILGMVDGALGVSDLVRVGLNIYASKSLESWEIKARSGLVTLSPDRSVVVPFQQQILTATIKNNTQTAYYEWSTSGKYGKLTDTKGHTDLVSFSSADKDVKYISRVNSANLTNGDNLEYIYVTAFAGGIKVGTDTAVINVKKDRYEMKPSGITLSGREGSQHEVRLYLLKPDGSNNIAPNSTADYKVIWTTAGKYGKLNAKDITGVRTLTLYDDNSAYYECLDKDTKNATETITARVYIKLKGEPESEYRLFDEATGSIKIDNDPKKRIFYVSTSLYHFDETNSCASSQPGCNICYKATVAYVPEDKDAISYSIRFFGQSIPGGSTNQSWTPTNHSFYGPSFGLPKYSGGKFTVVYDQSTVGSLAGQLEHVNRGGSGGMAEVTIILK